MAGEAVPPGKPAKGHGGRLALMPSPPEPRGEVEKALIQKAPSSEVKKQVEELIKLCCQARSSLRTGPSTKAETVTA